MDTKLTLADVEHEWWRIERVCHTIRPCAAAVLHQTRPVRLDRLPYALRLTIEVWYQFDFEWLCHDACRQAVEQALEEVLGEPAAVVFRLASWVPLPSALVSVLDWLMHHHVRTIGRHGAEVVMQAPPLVTADAQRIVDRHRRRLVAWWDRMEQWRREEWEC